MPMQASEIERFGLQSPQRCDGWHKRRIACARAHHPHPGL